MSVYHKHRKKANRYSENLFVFCREKLVKVAGKHCFYTDSKVEFKDIVIDIKLFQRRQSMTLKDLKPGMSARIETVGGRGALRQHFLDMGMIPGVKVTVIKYAPLGDPVELRIHGYELTLRLDEEKR